MFSVIIDTTEYRSTTPLTISGNGVFRESTPDGYSAPFGRWISSNSPIEVVPVESDRSN